MNKEEISPYYEETTDGYRRLTYKEVVEDLQQEIERLNNIINEQDKELELERKSRQLLTDDLANVCEMSLKKDNIINKGIEAINVYQNEKTLSVGYEDLKRIRGILQGNEFDLRMFEEYLQELKGDDKE